MLTLKWVIGLVCLLYPDRVEGVWRPASDPDARLHGSTTGEAIHHKDHGAC
jgi:hypothetical protein